MTQNITPGSPIVQLFWYKLKYFPICFPGQTSLIPQLCEDDVASGLSTKLLRQIVDKPDVTEALLKYVVLELPPRRITKPYDASGVDLIRILSKSTEYKLISRLMELGMKLKPSQMEALVLFIPPKNQHTFDMLLYHAHKNKFPQSSFNAACLKAMNMQKIGFISKLISEGAAPPADELVSVVGFSDNPIIQQYLASQATEPGVKHDRPECPYYNQDCTYERVSTSMIAGFALLYSVLFFCMCDF